jgi:hypothetical protein
VQVDPNNIMEMWTGLPRWIAVLIVAGLFHSAAAKSYTVGGTVGWTLGIGPTFYDDWAKPLTFVPGDTLGTQLASHDTLNWILEISPALLLSQLIKHDNLDQHG